MGKWLKGFPPKASLHPFEQALLELTLTDGRYEKTIIRVDNLRKSLLEIGKGHAAKAAKAPTKQQCLVCRCVCLLRCLRSAEVPVQYEVSAESPARCPLTGVPWRGGRDMGFEEMESMFRKNVHVIDSLKDLSTILRNLPVVEPT
eukprot:3707642-Pyramimonas_sp.AAC.1